MGDDRSGIEILSLFKNPSAIRIVNSPGHRYYLNALLRVCSQFTKPPYDLIAHDGWILEPDCTVEGTMCAGQIKARRGN